ncbi:MAG: metal-sensitive transcriptional regulator [Thermodesulfobacteriota bacterium]
MTQPDRADPASKNVLARLRRIEGQIRGIQKMVEEGQDCEKVLVQVKAAQSALRAASGLILKASLAKCYARGGSETPDEVLERLNRTADIITRYIE